jgi:nicotinamidase-related amidase
MMSSSVGVPDPALVVIDMQRLFGDPSSPWATPGFDGIVKYIDELARAFGEDRTTFTRFVIPPTWDGSWTPYYREWSAVTEPGAKPLMDLVEPFASRNPPTLDRPTFSKWGSELHEAAGPSRTLVLCGVATDCCVIATALPAADTGMFVRVVADATAGATPQAHDAALAVMRGFTPQIEVTTTAEELDRLRTAAAQA